MSTDRRVGVVLAGGRGTRLGGHDKAALTLAGRTLLDRAFDLLAPFCTERLVVGGPARPNLPPDARVVPDRRPGAGPLAGLEAALTSAAAPVLVLAVDTPLIRAATLAALVERAASNDADAVVIRHPGGIEPLTAWYAPACLPAITALLDAGERAVLALFPRVRTIYVDVAGGPDQFLGANRPDELQRLETLLTQTPNPEIHPLP